MTTRKADYPVWVGLAQSGGRRENRKAGTRLEDVNNGELAGGAALA